MDHDDAQLGRVLSRREAMALFGAAGVAMVGGAWPGAGPFRTASGPRPSCIVRPEQTEGPYFVDGRLNRSDIRADPETGVQPQGVRLDLAFQVSRVGPTECRPLADALVDVWQCDGLGVYSDVKDTNGLFDTVGQKFLRGHQNTDATGTASFVTLYPGWYRGRTVHIHFKIRTPRADGGNWDFTSQLYFDDALTDRVTNREPYTRNRQQRVRNEGDGIFRRGGDQLLLDVTPRGDGYAATFAIGLQFD